MWLAERPHDPKLTVPLCGLSGGAIPCGRADDLVDLSEFAETGSARGPIVLPSVGNRVLALAHDDGWRLSLFFADWEPVRALLHALARRLTSASIEALDRPLESGAIRVTATGVHACRGTFDIDGLLNGRLTGGWDLHRSRIARISSSPAPRRRRPEFTRRFFHGAGEHAA
jgi:hypothetical protein